MNQNIGHEEDLLFASSHQLLVKKYQFVKILIATGFIACGLCLGILALTNQINGQTFKLTLLLIGIILLAYGIFIFINKAKQKVYVKTGSPVSKKSLFFDSKYLFALQHCLETGSFNDIDKLQTKSNGNLRLDLLLSVDGLFAGAQLFNYESYLYKPYTNKCYFFDNQAKELQSFVKRID